MNRIRDNLILIVVVLEALFLMLPTTSMFLFGMGLSILGFFQGGNNGTLNPVYLYVAGLLLFPGYALYSLWWLVFSYRKLTLNIIPIRIWFGLLIGIIITGLVFSPFSITSPTEYISSVKHLRTYLVFGLGPLIVTATLITSIYVNKCSKNV